MGGVKSALEAVPGVTKVTVDLASKLATIVGTAKGAELVSAVEKTGKKATGCACNCGPGCTCVAGECGCATGACKCDPAKCAVATPTYETVHLVLAATVGALVGSAYSGF